MLGFKKQRPEDRLDYDVDFSRWLTPGDTITDTAAQASEGMLVEQAQIAGQVVKVWLSGGQAGKTYEVDLVVTTAQGRVKEETFLIRVSDC